METSRQSLALNVFVQLARLSLASALPAAPHIVAPGWAVEFSHALRDCSDQGTSSLAGHG